MNFSIVFMFLECMTIDVLVLDLKLNLLHSSLSAIFPIPFSYGLDCEIYNAWNVIRETLRMALIFCRWTRHPLSAFSVDIEGLRNLFAYVLHNGFYGSLRLEMLPDLVNPSFRRWMCLIRKKWRIEKPIEWFKKIS